MSQIQAVHTKKAPKPPPQSPQAVVYNHMVYCSGIRGIDPTTGEHVDGGIKGRTAQALKNLSAILSKANSGVENVVKVTIFLYGSDNATDVDEAYDEFFTKEPKPCRTCVAINSIYQPPICDVEIECTAYQSAYQAKEASEVSEASQPSQPSQPNQPSQPHRYIPMP